MKRFFFSIIIFLLFFSSINILGSNFFYQNLNSERRKLVSNHDLLVLNEYNSLIFQTEQKSSVSTSIKVEISSYLGGIDTDEISFMEMDKNNNIYLAGLTSSWNFPLSNPTNSFLSNDGGFLTKISPKGTIIFSTFIDGSNNDYIDLMVLDNDDNVYLMGTTNSPDFITVNAYDDTINGENDIFLMKISSDGEIIYSTFLGGSGTENSLHFYQYVPHGGMVFDSQNNLYIAGWTQSNDFPLINAFDNTFNGSSDGFISKFSPTGNLLFSSYLGGDALDGISHLGIDKQDNVYLGGVTNSSNFQMINAFDNTFNGKIDVFLSKISPAGSLIFNTYLGGTDSDCLREFTISKQEVLFLVGWTDSPDFLTVNALDDTYNGNVDIFLTEIDLNGQLKTSTYIGGTGSERTTSIIEDSNSNLYLSGHTTNWEDFPYTNILLNTTSLGPNDIFLMKIDVNGQITFSIIIGGENNEIVPHCVIDFQNNIYLAFMTSSTNLNLINAFDTVHDSSMEVLIVKLSSDGDLLFSSFLGGLGEDVPLKLLYNGDLYITGSTTSSDFPIINAFDSKNGEESGFISEGFFTKILIDTDMDEIPDGWELENGLNPCINDADEDLEDDGMPNLWEYQMGLRVNSNDADGDLDFDGLTNIQEYRFNSSAARSDTDLDGITDFYEYYNGLNPVKNDANEDLDHDGLTNIREYRYRTYANNSDSDNDGMDDLFEHNFGLNPNLDDANDDADLDRLTNVEEYNFGSSVRKKDTDQDGMDDFFEYQHLLNPRLDDANNDKDGDWVSNYVEYRENTNASDMFNVPIFYSEFPFICFSIVHMLLFCFTLTTGALGGTGAFVYQYYVKKKLIKQTCAPDYYSALLIKKGNFPDYETYLKAEKLHILTFDEYNFVLELKEMEKNL